MTAKQMHITFGEDKMLVECTFSNFKSTVESVFNIVGKDFRVQTWNAFYGDWVNIDDVASLEDLPQYKLNIILRNSSSKVVIDSIEAPKPIQVLLNHVDQDINAPVEPKPDKRFPMIYVLPKFPVHIEAALEQRSVVCREDYFRKHIINTLFDDLLQYGLFPGERAYSDSCRELITKYEFLKDSYAINGVGYHSWVTRLRNKFKKYRARSKCLVPTEEQIRMKEKYGRKRAAALANQDSEDKEEGLLNKIQRVLDIPGSLEDEISVAAHLKALKQECEKQPASSAIIAEKMSRTYGYRLQMIREKRVMEVLEVFPCLRMEKEILAEGDRSYKVNVLVLKNFLQRHFEHIVKSAMGKEAKVLRELYSTQERTDETDENLACLLLSYCLKEESLFSSTLRTTLYPYIHYDAGDFNIFSSLTTFTLFVDGIEISKCRDVSTALTACFLMFWIFDIKYTKDFFGVLSFLDIHVFKKCSVKPKLKVINFINKL